MYMDICRLIDVHVFIIHVIFNDLVVNSRYCNLSYALPPDQQYLPIWKKSYLKFSSGQEIFLFTNIGQRLIIQDNRRLF